MNSFLYVVTLSGGTFHGFLIQARLVSDDSTLVGSFSMPPTGTKLSNCNPSQVYMIVLTSQGLLYSF